MMYDVTFKRMSETVPTHVIHYCDTMEKAIRLTRDQYPGCLVITAVLISA